MHTIAGETRSRDRGGRSVHMMKLLRNHTEFAGCRLGQGTQATNLSRQQPVIN